MPLVTSTTKIDWSNADRDYKKGQNLIRKGDWATGFKLHELRALPDAFWNPTAKFPGVRTNFDRAPIWMPGQSIIPDFITLAENRLRRELRVRQMLKSVTTSTVSGDATVEVPSDFLEIRDFVVMTNPIQPLSYSILKTYITPSR